MTGRRIEFPSNDAGRFNALRDQWRAEAAGAGLSKSGLRVATVLPGFVNREYGYAFPTDGDIASEIQSDPKTAKRGLTALEKAGLIERVTRTKRDEKSEAIGRERRIYLTLPTVRSERTVAATTKPKVKGQEVKGQPEVKGQKRAGEGTYGCPYILDTTPDEEIRSGTSRLASTREEVVPSPQSVPSPAPSAPTSLRPFRSSASAPLSWGSDIDFLDAFDRSVQQLAGKDVPAGSIERIAATAFDLATSSNSDNMPVFWKDIIGCRTSSTATWFRDRASAVIHQRIAA